MKSMRRNHEFGPEGHHRFERRERFGGGPGAPGGFGGGPGEGGGRGGFAPGGGFQGEGPGRPGEWRGRSHHGMGGGPHGMRGGGPRGGGRGRARRGDVRAAALALLAERPMHGYEMIQELESRTGGVWRPSPGSLYPALQLLQDEGLVTADDSSGKRLLTLTDAGREAREAAGADQRPWEHITAGVPPVHKVLRDGIEQIATATRQVAAVGTEEEKARAVQILTDTRKALYKLLADSE
ncbi:PadR family transcriptional regulator [Streptomyces sp. NPDC021093]|uniref:PadR family transcriptional regulator n=1 Tax=Streptomyces sp. NPDC021093 TaxID=3365112 RepID=UPI003795FD15